MTFLIALGIAVEKRALIYLDSPVNALRAIVVSFVVQMLAFGAESIVEGRAASFAHLLGHTALVMFFVFVTLAVSGRALQARATGEFDEPGAR